MGGESTLTRDDAVDHIGYHIVIAAIGMAMRVAVLGIIVVHGIVACCALASRCTTVGYMAARSPISLFFLLSLLLNLLLSIL